MKKNVASQVIGAQMVNATTGAAFTSSVTAYVTGDAGTQAVGSVGSGACAHEGNGFHTYAPAQAETNYDHIGFTFIGTGAVPVTVQVYTMFPQTGDAFARIGAPVGASISADIAGVQSDTDNIQTRIPAALVSGRIDASVGAMASAVLTATAIASDAITDAKVASDVTIASVTGSVGSIASAGISEASFATTAGSFAPLGIIDQGTAQAATGTTLQLRSAAAFANSELIGALVLITGGSAGVGQVRVITAYTSSTDTATVDTWTTTPTGTITYKILAAPPIATTLPAVNVTQFGGSAGTFSSGRPEVNTTHAAGTAWNSGAIAATTLASDTLTAAKIAADVTTELQAGLATASALSTAQADLDDIQTRLPAALVGGRIDANVGAISSDATAADNLEAALDGTGGVTITAAVTGNITGNLSGSVGSVTGNVGGNVTGSVGSVVGAVGSVTGNVGGNVTGSVGSVASGGISSASFASGAITAAAIAADAIGASELAADAVIEIANAVLDTSSASHLVAGSVGAILGKLDTTLEPHAGSPTEFRFTSDALLNAPSGGLSESQVRAAVWDAPIASYLDSGSTGEALNAAGGAGDPWVTALPGSYSSGQAGYILGTNLNATVSSRATQASVDTIDDFLDTEVAAIKAKTDNLPSDPADASDIASSFSTVNSTLSTIAGYIDTEVAAIKAKTDNLPASPAATGDIPSAASIADAVWDEAVSGHVSAGTFGKALDDTDDRGSRTVIRGTVSGTSPTTTTFTASALSPAGAASDQFKGRIIIFDNDTTTTALRGQATDITASSNASLPLFTYTALTTAPQSGDTFSIV